jgi:hypothetical protein
MKPVMSRGVDGRRQMDRAVPGERGEEGNGMLGVVKNAESSGFTLHTGSAGFRVGTADG